MAPEDDDAITREQKLEALLDVARFDPRFTVLIIVLGMVAALLEGAGLSFILPIVEIVQSDDPVANASGPMAVFVSAYQAVGIPFTLGYVVLGVSAVMVARYTFSFLVDWFREALRNYYVRDLQIRAFDNTLDASVAYFDEEGSDDMLNAIVTQTYYAGRVIKRVVQFFEQSFLALVYLLLALAFAPRLTVIAIGILGVLTVLLRHVLEPGYAVGDVVAEANERRQESAQAGTQGIRDVRIFGIADELFADFSAAVDRYTDAQITLRRNEAAIDRFYNLGVSVSLFVLIFLAITYANLSLGALGIFLFAMFRLGPRVSTVNTLFYQVENDLPHLVRTQQFIAELEAREEPNDPTREVPSEVTPVEFDDVYFSYPTTAAGGGSGDAGDAGITDAGDTGDAGSTGTVGDPGDTGGTADAEAVLTGIDFEVEQGEFVAFVGQSGAGKSTIVSLLARLYEPDSGEIRANGVPIGDVDVDEWRDRITVVRQNPFVFNDTLRYNLTLGNRDATQSEIDRVCAIAKVDEFLDDLPAGYDTVLGDEGVRLSGGQKQRVALARSLLEDAELLILDEATSDLDSNLERQVQQAIEAMEREYAIVTIAHRLSTVRNADRIYTVADGEIEEVGRHEQLLDNDGTYAELYAIQSRG